MLGAIIGDVVGSRFEFNNIKSKDFVMFTDDCHMTDDSLMTLAVADALFLCRKDFNETKYKEVLIQSMKQIAHKYPHVGWGANFYKFLFKENCALPYNSFGNGAGMRISPVAWVANSEDEVKYLSRITTEISHNHIEGIKGAECIAMCTYLARMGKDKEYIKDYVINNYYPRLKNMTIENTYPSYDYDDEGMWVTCQGSIPEAVLAFLESKSFEDCIRNVVLLGGDVDTIGAMAGAIAEAYYGISYDLEDQIMKYIPDDLKTIYYSFYTIKAKKK